MIAPQVIQADNIILSRMSYQLAHRRQLQLTLIVLFYFEDVYCFKFNLLLFTVFLFVCVYFLFPICFLFIINKTSHLTKFFRDYIFVRFIFQE